MYGPLPPCSTRSTFFDDEDVDSGDDEDDEEEEEYEGRVEGYVGRATLWCCSYESITAAEGLSAWSFEELRVECYAQSLVARGTKPPLAVQPALAIPPAFVPRSVPRN
ncbi:hypothetical protein J3R82DRAFT_3185 [Butyriboletus roseoflavus]|nr:hypothetical protein J3R82DRAFT_3185 [Butyriboletus roseoflavus]